MRPHIHHWASCTTRVQTGRKRKRPMRNSSANTGETTQFVKTLRKVSWPTTPFGISLLEFPKRICKLFSQLYPIESLILICGSQILSMLDLNGAALHAKTHCQCHNGTAPPASLEADNSQHQPLATVPNIQFLGNFIVVFFFPLPWP